MRILKYCRFLIWPIALMLSAWTLFQLPLATITTSIQNLSWNEYALWIALNSLIMCVGVLRWSVLIKMLKVSIHFGFLLCIRQAGQTVSFITPGPQFGGEPLQVFWLHRRGMALQKILLSLGLDRFFELWINFSMLLVWAVLISANNVIVTDYKIVGSLIFLLMCVTSIPLLLYQPKWLLSCFGQLTRPWAEHPNLLKIKSHLSSLVTDFRVVFKTQKPSLVLALLLSLASWLALIGELLLLLKFVGVSLDLAGFAILLVALRLALLLPIPGGIGTLEASVFWSFQLLNLPGSAALGLIALMRMRDATMLLIGVWCLRKVGTKPDKIINSECAQ